MISAMSRLIVILLWGERIYNGVYFIRKSFNVRNGFGTLLIMALVGIMGAMIELIYLVCNPPHNESCTYDHKRSEVRTEKGRYCLPNIHI